MAYNNGIVTAPVGVTFSERLISGDNPSATPSSVVPLTENVL